MLTHRIVMRWVAGERAQFLDGLSLTQPVEGAKTPAFRLARLAWFVAYI